jgi:hypothetical protein
LHRAAGIRCRDEGWSAVSLAFSAFERHPRSWYAVGAALSAVRVASAQASSTVADKLCELGDIALRQGIDIPAAHHPVGEAAEYHNRIRGEGGQAQPTEMAAALTGHTTPAVHHEDDHRG